MNLTEEINKYAGTRIRTSFIGALDQFEKTFGYLWGEGKDENSLTEQEQEFYEMFLQMRSRILRLGNDQIRVFRYESERILGNEKY